MAERPLRPEDGDRGEDSGAGEEGGTEREEEEESGYGQGVEEGREEQGAEEEEGEGEEWDESEEEEERVVKRKIVIVVSFGGKGKEEGQSPPPPEPRHGADVGCQVDGCGVDLGEAKRYHRRHKVCEGHAKAPVASVCGVDQRFCQQCSRQLLHLFFWQLAISLFKGKLRCTTVSMVCKIDQSHSGRSVVQANPVQGRGKKEGKRKKRGRKRKKRKTVFGQSRLIHNSTLIHDLDWD